MPGLAGIGHNHPPEIIEDYPLQKGDREFVEDALEILRKQPPEPDPKALAQIEAAESGLKSVIGKIGAYLVKQGDNFVSEAVKAAGKTAGVAGTGIVTVWAFHLHSHLQALVQAIGEWIQYLNLPF